MPFSFSQSCRFSCSLLRVETVAEILCLFEAVARTDHVGAKASGQDRNPRSAANIADPASAAVAHQSDDRALVAIAGGTHRHRDACDGTAPSAPFQRLTIDQTDRPDQQRREGLALGQHPGLNVGEGHDIRSEEHTSELQSLMRISYAVFCLKKKT